MRRKRNQLIAATSLSIVVLHLIQMVFVDTFLSIGVFVPDLLLILTAFVGMRLGQTAGCMTGFAAGLLQDTSIQFLGLMALSKTFVGFFARYFRADRVLLAEKFYFPFVVFVLSLLHDVIRYSIQTLNSDVAFATLMWERALLTAVYSGVGALLLWWVVPDAWINFVKFDKRFDQ